MCLDETSREIRRDMKDWCFLLKVINDVRDLEGHLDTTFRGWSSTLAARVRLVISRLVSNFCSSSGLSWSGSGCQVYVFTCCPAWD